MLLPSKTERHWIPACAGMTVWVRDVCGTGLYSPERHPREGGGPVAFAFSTGRHLHSPDRHPGLDPGSMPFAFMVSNLGTAYVIIGMAEGHFRDMTRIRKRPCAA